MLVAIAESGLEVWKPIPGFPDYEASSLGRIRSCKWGYWKTIKPGRHRKNGYLIVCLRVAGKYVTRSVHRLIAAAFLGDAEGRDVNHKNGNKHDNRLTNLEYLSRGDNHRHAYRTGLRSPVGKRLTDQQVQQIFALKGRATQALIARQFGISRAAVSLIHTGQRHRSVLTAEGPF